MLHDKLLKASGNTRAFGIMLCNTLLKKVTFYRNLFNKAMKVGPADIPLPASVLSDLKTQ